MKRFSRIEGRIFRGVKEFGAGRVRVCVLGVVVLGTLASSALVVGFCEEGTTCVCDSNPIVCTNFDTRRRCHREITEAGLAFMRPILLEHVVQSNLHMDHSHIDTLWSHADGCDFRTTGHNINEIYSSEVVSNNFTGICVPFHCTLPHSDTWGVTGLLSPNDPRPNDAAAAFGYALHPIQDFYSHSNWVEIFRGIDEPPLVEPTLDLWFTQPWVPLAQADPAFMDQHHPGHDAVVFAEENGFQDDWHSSEANFQPYFLPTITTNGGPTYLGVISGLTHGSLFQEEECAEGMRVTHTDLNKDSPCMSVQHHGVGPDDHHAAAELATRQTAHEWCRILHIVQGIHGSAGVAVPMGFWVDSSAPETGPGSPHAPGTPCAASAPGNIEISVSVETIRVLSDTDEDDPGELNFTMALFTHDLTRSTRSEVNLVTADDGESIGGSSVPAPISMCLTADQANAAVATIQAWDDDIRVILNPPPHPPVVIGVPGELNPNSDQALRGVYAEIALHALGIHTVSSPSMEVTFNIQQASTDSDGDGLSRCDEVMRGTDDADADSDDDGYDDGAEVGAGTDPLDADSDDDGLLDGTEFDLGTDPLDTDSDDDGLDDGEEIALGTDPLDSDSDDDGLSDGDEIHIYGTDPTDPDSDDDLLDDGVEVTTGVDPVNPDSDGDGLLDGQDVEWILNAIVALPPYAFRQPSNGNRNAMQSILNEIEQLLPENASAALRNLENLRRKVDGCGSMPDRNDWIIDCPSQLLIRGYLDQLSANLQSMMRSDRNERKVGLP